MIIPCNSKSSAEECKKQLELCYRYPPEVVSIIDLCSVDIYTGENIKDYSCLVVEDAYAIMPTLNLSDIKLPWWLRWVKRWITVG